MDRLRIFPRQYRGRSGGTRRIDRGRTAKFTEQSTETQVRWECQGKEAFEENLSSRRGRCAEKDGLMIVTCALFFFRISRTTSRSVYESRKKNRRIDTTIISLLLHLGEAFLCRMWSNVNANRLDFAGVFLSCATSSDLLEPLRGKTTMNKTRALDARSTPNLC